LQCREVIDKVAFDEKLGPKVLMQREQKIVEMMAGDKMKDEAAHLFRMMSAMPAARRMSVMPGIRITDDEDGDKKAMVRWRWRDGSVLIVCRRRGNSPSCLGCRNLRSSRCPRLDPSRRRERGLRPGPRRKGSGLWNSSSTTSTTERVFNKNQRKIVVLFASGGRKKRIDLSFPPKRGGLLRLSRAFSATLTGRFGMGTVRMGASTYHLGRYCRG
jgi:hypothetical protein